MKVFVVEESAVIRERLRGMLESIPGVELAGEVDSEAEAVRSICSLLPDVVILDFMLASGNGLGVLRGIRMQPLDICVIVLTNDVYPQYRKKCMEAGADFFLDKSRDIEALGNLLSRLTEGRYLR
jgi:DNA-binding NarL/FixJ family response regulator